MAWRPIEFCDVPSREEFEEMTLALMRDGVTNSDEMTSEMRRDRKLILQKAAARWNDTFRLTSSSTNMPACLKNLVVRSIIEKIIEKE